MGQAEAPRRAGAHGLTQAVVAHQAQGPRAGDLIEEVAVADLVVTSRPILEARSSNVLLVLTDGVIRLAHPHLKPLLGAFAGAGEERTVGGVHRWTSTRANERRPLQ